MYLLDLLHTFCDLTGIEPPATSQGISFKPVLMGRQEVVREVVYGAFSGDSKPGIRCVKKGDWKLIKYEIFESREPGSQQVQVNETQLFNLADNPLELLDEHHDAEVIALTRNTPLAQQVNLARLREHADRLRELEALLLREQQRLDDPYRFTDLP